MPGHPGTARRAPPSRRAQCGRDPGGREGDGGAASGNRAGAAA